MSLLVFLEKTLVEVMLQPAPGDHSSLLHFLREGHDEGDQLVVEAEELPVEVDE